MPKKINRIINNIILNLKIKLISTSEKKFFNKKTVKIVFKEQIVKKIFVFELSVLNKLIISIKNMSRNNIKIISNLKIFFFVLRSIRVETSKIIKYNI
tara:strand:- start:7189 stop:7482 length:294 start_codon:yes stop_codon:yes gene_type:complete